MSKKVIITGVNGFVGEHVVDAFNHQDIQAIGVGHDELPNEKVSEKLISYVSCNLLDMASVAKISFDDVVAIVHLAGLSNVGDSFNRPLSYMNDNSTMTYNLLAHAQSQNFHGRIIVVSSGALYNPNEHLPLTELSPSLENSPYAVGKLAVEHIARYFKQRGLDVVIVRPFNHIGPGQGKGFIVPDLYSQLAQANSSGNDTISVGNLSTRRDYTDVRDIARAYLLIATAPKLNHSLYNICTGRSLSGSDILSSLQDAMAVSHIETTVDQSKVRPNDIMEIYGDSTRLREDTGWEPEIDIHKTIEDFVSTQQ